MPTLDLLPATVEDFRRRAEKRLPRGLFDYVDGGAGAEVTLRRNVEDFEAIQLGQRVLRDISKTSTEVEFLGEKLSMPVILAPVGMAGMMAKRGEVMARRVSAQAGIPMCLSTMSICPIEEVVPAAETPMWFQLYMFKDRGVVAEMLDRAWNNGVRKLVFTVDLNVLGTRYRDFRNGLAGGTSLWGKIRGGPIEYLSHPHWLRNVALGGGPLLFGNIKQFAPAAKSLPDFRVWGEEQLDSSVDWKDIEWLRGIWKGQLILKGILDPQDAKDAHKVGADSIVVSNHGGRQLD
ncbi:MAG: L-lactate dehydrogenase, partial [Sphingomonadaceae bacterium]|nr:L-lactate dehydrogenase [Sphingomonadaceae bacterium]